MTWTWTRRDEVGERALLSQTLSPFRTSGIAYDGNGLAAPHTDEAFSRVLPRSEYAISSALHQFSNEKHATLPGTRTVPPSVAVTRGEIVPALILSEGRGLRSLGMSLSAVLHIVVAASCNHKSIRHVNTLPTCGWCHNHQVLLVCNGGALSNL